jgi:hypothetical protein
VRWESSKLVIGGCDFPVVRIIVRSLVSKRILVIMVSYYVRSIPSVFFVS